MLTVPPTDPHSLNCTPSNYYTFENEHYTNKPSTTPLESSPSFRGYKGHVYETNRNNEDPVGKVLPTIHQKLGKTERPVYVGVVREAFPEGMGLERHTAFG